MHFFFTHCPFFYYWFQSLYYLVHCYIYVTNALRLLALCELLFTLTCTRVFVIGKGENYDWRWKFKKLTLHWKYLSCVIGINLRICVTNYPVEPLKQRSWHNSEVCLLLVVNSDKYLLHLVNNSTFRISVPDYPSRTIETTFLGQL